MHKLHTLRGIAALAALSLTTVTQGATTIIASSDGQVRDTNQSGTGNSANAGTPFAGFHTNTRNGNIKPVWAFSLLDAGAPAAVTSATFSVDVTNVPAATNFNLDLYAVRIVAATTFATDNGGDGFLAEDYQNGAANLEDFWKPTDELGIRTADMTTYLQSRSWSSTDFLIVGLKKDIISTVQSDWTSFGPAQLAVVPEPSSAALLLGLCGFTLTLLRRRR